MEVSRRAPTLPLMVQLQGNYVPSTLAWVRDQIDLYERTSGAEGNTLLETGIPVIIVTMRGARSASVRKIALMRVEFGGSYALIASKGGAPDNPDWYHNLLAHPTEVLIQDGPEPFQVTVRQVEGAEREQWWTRSVEVFPTYDEYQSKTERQIPVLIAEPLI
jgi:deazaflavin-dependent oxidoreductase (nitroreductase family)